MIFIERPKVGKVLAMAAVGLLAGCGSPTHEDHGTNTAPVPVAAPRPLAQPNVEFQASSLPELIPSPEPVSAPKAQVVSNYRRTIGTWNQQEVEALAQGMVRQTKFPNISRAGEILRDGQQGSLSTSRLTPIFSDSRVSIETVQNFPSRPLLGDFNIPVDGTFSEGPEQMRVVLPSLTGGEPFEILANTSLLHKSIEISAQQANDRSNFWLEFMVASNVLMPQAVDHVSSYFVNKALYKIYQEPKDFNVNNAIQAASLRTSIGGIPSVTMASIWSFYLMLPDYELAVSSGKIVESSGDWGDNTLFKRSLEKFRNDGILVRNPQGQLEYPKIENGTRYQDRVYTSWIHHSQQLIRESVFQKSLHRA